MSEAHQIEVKTIYAAADAAKAGLRLRVLGALTLLAGLAWLYVVWWPVLDRVQTPLMFGQLNIAMQAAPTSGQAEKGQRDLAALNQLLMGPAENGGAQPPSASQNEGDPDAAAGESDDAADQADVPADGTSGMLFAGGVLVFAALAWLGVPTLVGVWLLMAGASTLGSTRSTRTFGKLLALVAMVGLAGLTWYVWREYEWFESILPDWVKPSMLGAAVAAGVGLGAMMNRRGAWLLRAGGWLVVVSACVSALALWASVRWGRMPGEGIDLGVYLKLFAAQSAYGWFLLLAMVGAR